MNETNKPASPGKAYRAGMGVAALTAFLGVWITIVRDDGSGTAFFPVIMAIAVGGFATRFRADGMARTMLGVAAMQAMLGLLTATAPVTATAPDGIFRTILFHGVATILWLVSAAFFRAAANRHPRASA